MLDMPLRRGVPKTNKKINSAPSVGLCTETLGAFDI